MSKKKYFLWRSREGLIETGGDYPMDDKEIAQEQRCIYCLQPKNYFSVQTVLPGDLDLTGMVLDDVVCGDCDGGSLAEIDVHLTSVLERLLADDHRSSPVDVKSFGQDSLAQRAIAKVAFHYLAMKHGKPVALEPRFDPIREYILDGRGSQKWVQVFPDSSHIPFRKVEGTHMVSIVATRSDLVCFGSLFDRINFGVRLGPNTSTDPMAPHLTYWHYETSQVTDVAMQDLGGYLESTGSLMHDLEKLRASPVDQRSRTSI